ncbi:hypothetical protein RB3485 [Rhodopirellula baltica SH 1]|uniref:Uncharacterized protein n=1 Tax=Rhodopirellula baltica (strain DSM 10527 / NCIMB 13988 / SH1) TaxID=243090 RepID=Q7UU64_RHOBA|nr:hypothetical protein RB3485 [Rhodopirellula baltica SH 1]
MHDDRRPTVLLADWHSPRLFRMEPWPIKNRRRLRSGVRLETGAALEDGY